MRLGRHARSVHLKVIGQYKGILARSPHDATAFARLLEMYKRYRTTIC